MCMMLWAFAALTQFPNEHWIYWVGPALGALCAVGFYRLIKMLEYETANPGADFNEKEAEVFHFDEENTARGSEIVRPNVAFQPTPADLEREMNTNPITQKYDLTIIATNAMRYTGIKYCNAIMSESHIMNPSKSCASSVCNNT